MPLGLAMRIAYLDCFSGISGDMFLGAAVDAGVSLEKLQSVAAALGLDASLVAHKIQRSGISATKVDVLIHGRPDHPTDEPMHEHEHSHEHEHTHALSHEDEHAHPHAHEQGHSQEFSHAHRHSHEAHSHEHALQAEHTHTHRGLPEIRQIIARAPFSDAAKAFAVTTFELLAAAEGKIHNQSPESIHFHEVGSEDAIVDIVCAAVAIEAIAADAWYCSALNVGSGTVRCAHGVLPVPAPATAELLRSAPIYSAGVPKELLTPTGAAILKALNVRYEPLPALSLTATGYGAGARDFPGMANVVRLILGDSASADGPHPETGGPYSPSFGECGEQYTAPLASNSDTECGKQNTFPSGENSDTVVVLEANIDDMNPQLFSYVLQKLLTAGALDAFGVPVQMKKGRPGLIFTVLAPPTLVEPLSRILLTETTTLGVRTRTEQRRILQRKHVTVQSQWGPIRVKLGILQGEIVNFAPEFEDCRSIAEAHRVPLKIVLQQATSLYVAQASATGSNALPDQVSAASLKSS